RIEHRLEVRERELLIELLGEAFEIDVGRVHHFIERPTGGWRDVAGGDGDGFHTGRATAEGSIDGILGPHHRVVVRKRHAPAAELASGGGDGFGGGGLREEL